MTMGNPTDPYDRCKHGRQFCVSCHYDEPKRAQEELAKANADKGAYAQNAIDLQARAKTAEQLNAELIDLLARLVQLQKDDCEIRGGIPTRWQPLLDEADAIIKSKTKP